MKQTYDDENMENEDEEDDDDDVDNVVFGITSVINMTSRKTEPAVKTLETLLVSKCKECKNTKEIEALLQGNQKSIGFLINERYVNIPAPVSVPLFENLHKEIIRAVEKKKDFEFDYFFMIIKLHRNAVNKDEFYVNPEEELFEQKSIYKYEYSVASESDTGLTGKWKEEDEQLEPIRRVVVLEGNKFNEIIQSISGFLTGN